MKSTRSNYYISNHSINDYTEGYESQKEKSFCCCKILNQYELQHAFTSTLELFDERVTNPLTNGKNIMEMEQEKAKFIFSADELFSRLLIGTSMLIVKDNPIISSSLSLLLFVMHPIPKLFNMILSSTNLEEFDILQLTKIFDPKCIEIQTGTQVMHIIEKFISETQTGTFVFPRYMFIEGCININCLVEQLFLVSNVKSFTSTRTCEEIDHYITNLTEELCSQYFMD